jgi:hypothetical protein
VNIKNSLENGEIFENYVLKATEGLAKQGKLE